MSEGFKERIELEIEPENIGKIDLLIENGLYEDRKSFFTNAIQQLIDVHKKTIENFKIKNNFVLGLLNYSRSDLEKVVAEGKKLNIRVIGGLSFSDDISPALADKAIEKISMAGVFKARPEVKQKLVNKQFTLICNPKKYLLKHPHDDTSE